MQTIRISEPLRAFAPPSHIDALLDDYGNEINNYSAANFCNGASTVHICTQVASGGNSQDPSWYKLPAFQECVWYQQRETNSVVTTKMVYFAFSLARNWQADSLRLFHFLPAARAAAIATNHFRFTWDDWVLAFRGLAVSYGAMYCTAFQEVFQLMHSTVCNERTGHSFSYEFLESYTIDMFYRFTAAARNPRLPTILPGTTVEILPIHLTPETWAKAFYVGFEALVRLFDNPLSYQTWLLRRAGELPYPNPAHRPARSTHSPRSSEQLTQQRKDRPARPLPALYLPTPTGGSASGRARGPGTQQPPKLCFMSFLRQYKVNLKSTNTLPKKCEASCKRLHYANLPREFPKSTALEIAKVTSLVTEEARAPLLAAIAADPKLK
jgi:hypothetical protein